MVVLCRFFSFHFSLLLLLLISKSSSQQIESFPYCPNNKGNYTQNSTYHNNLKILLSNISSNTEITYGFYNFSYGENTNKVYAIGLCRGDVNKDDCRYCLKEIIPYLTKNCPNQKEAMAWFDNCILRYSNRSILGVMETDPWLRYCNRNHVTNDVDEFNQQLQRLLNALRKLVTSGNTHRKYAAGNSTSLKNLVDIYVLLQCTPDLSSQKCDECLSSSFGDLQTCNQERKLGGTIIRPSCIVRYENYPFFQSNEVLPSPLPSSKGKGNTSRTAIIIVVPILVVILFFCFIGIYLRPKNLREIAKNSSEDDEIITNESLQFNFDIIRVATDDFSDSNKLGQGGFGPVYRGELSNGQVIAVKRLSINSGQGDIEFKNEVLIVAKLQHRNLVRLLGFSIKERERLLVYELVPNKSLDYFIFDPTKKEQLDWEKRYKIIQGTARGLLYLHEDSRLRIIHRDLKTSNILLDEQMNPKISDFGMAKLIVVDQTQENTKRIVGTYGYMAPEYVMYGQFSVKSDVFSFGVLVLEIVSGQKNSSICRAENTGDLLSFAWKNWREGTTTNIIDPSLHNKSEIEITRCIHVGLLCVQENVAHRPTMAAVVLMLNSNSLTLAIPSEPGFFVGSKTRSLLDMQLWENNSVNEASITEPYPR